MATLRYQILQGIDADATRECGIDLSTGTTPGYPEITGAALKEHFTLLLRSAATLMTARTFSRDVFDKELSGIRARYTLSALASGGARAVPSLVTDLLASTVFGGAADRDADYSTATHIHRRHFRPSSLVVGIAGDISLDEARRLAADAFGGWQGGQARSPNQPPP